MQVSWEFVGKILFKTECCRMAEGQGRSCWFCPCLLPPRVKEYAVQSWGGGPTLTSSCHDIWLLVKLRELQHKFRLVLCLPVSPDVTRLHSCTYVRLHAAQHSGQVGGMTREAGYPSPVLSGRRAAAIAF